MNYIHCLNNISHYGTDLLTSDYELTDDISKATGILVRSAAMHDMEFADGLLAIARAGAGVNNIPLDRCAEEGIVVFNTPGANANAVKELVICSLLMGSRDIAGGIAWCRDNADDENIAKSVEKAKKAFAGREIMGKKLGIVGLGAIGAIVAQAAFDLGMEVWGYDPYLSPAAALKIPPETKYVTELEELCAACDYITIHVPAMPSTNGMIGADQIAVMKDDAVIINHSRDTLVDVAALAAAMETGKIHAYVTDFATPDVMKLPRTVVFPHLGASTEEAEDNCAVMATREIMDYIENGNITNSVNYPACNMGAATAPARIAVLHANIPDMISQITAVLGGAGVNIAKMANQARGEAAYTLIDCDQAVDGAVVDALEAIEGVRRVRVI